MKMGDQSEKLQIFRSLLSRGNDVTLICEGKEISACKSVLLNSCPYFEGLLSGSFPDGKGDVIKIDNTSYDVLTVVVNYACFKQFVVNDWDINKWKELFMTAHEYNLKDFLQLASEAFDVDQFDLWSLANAFPWLKKLELTTVVAKIWSLVDGFADELIDVKNRQQFFALPEVFIKSFVQRETLNVSEVALLDAITEWLQRQSNVELDIILNHIHWNEISDKDLRKQLWLGHSMDTSYKDKKPRCLESPQTIKQGFILPDFNVAQFGASKALLHVSDDDYAVPSWTSDCYQLQVSLTRPFAINAIKFKLVTSVHITYKVLVTTTDGNVYTVTPGDWSMSGCSYQEIYFEPKIVAKIRICATKSVGINSFVCMYSTNMPVLQNSYVVAEKNMIVSTKNILGRVSSLSMQHIEYTLMQKCYVSSMALYLRRDEDFQYELYDSRANKLIPATKLSVVKDGGLRTVLFQFEELLLPSVTVKSKDGVIHIVKAKCPAPQPLLNKVNQMSV